MDAILTFHSIDASGSVLSYAPEDFRRLVEGLLDDGVRVVTLADLLQPDPAGRRVALTFDDGFTSVRREALPVLEELKLPALLYAVSGWLGKQNRWPTQPADAPDFELMSLAELRELRDGGFEIGCHTANHPRLDRLEAADWDAEVEESRAFLEDGLGAPVRHFAYPYGAYDEEAVRRVGELFDTAVTTRLAFLGAAEDPLRLPRLDTYYLRRPGLHRPLFGGRTRWYLGVRAGLRRLRERLVG